MRNFILVVLAVVAFAGVTAAQQPTMEEICKKWDARRAAIKCVKYEIEEVTTHYNSTSTEVRGPQPKLKYGAILAQIKNTHTYIFDLNTGAYRAENRGQWWNHKTASVEPDHGAIVYVDGKMKSVKWPQHGVSSVGAPSVLQSDYVEITGSLRKYAFRTKCLPLLFDMGIVPLVAATEFYPGQFHKYRPGEFHDAVVPISGGANASQQSYSLASTGKGRATALRGPGFFGEPVAGSRRPTRP